MNKLKQLLVPAYIKLYKIYTLYIAPYKYVKEKYLNSFVSKVDKAEVYLSNAKEVLYVFWTGNNELTPNRKIALQTLKDNAGVNVKLITPQNLDEYIIKEYPLHEGFKYLSLIQKSDYLRCYFMLHHGGGYVDIKPCLDSWNKLFKKLNNSNKWCIGKREKHIGSIPNMDGNIGADCKKYHNNLISNGGYIYKPNSPIAKEWMDEIHMRLDFFKSDLQKNPGDEFGSGKYPIPWAYLAGYIMAPLILKYHDKVIPLDIDLYSSKNYR
jgi:hypothetical protein